jgi:hypothetical protein
MRCDISEERGHGREFAIISKRSKGRLGGLLEIGPLEQFQALPLAAQVHSHRKESQVLKIGPLPCRSLITAKSCIPHSEARDTLRTTTSISALFSGRQLDSSRTRLARFRLQI